MSRVAPLSDYLVLDLSQGVAGPSCGGLFAEYGARVVKIEPTGGEWMRHLGPGIPDLTVAVFAHNRGKESLSIDLKSDAGVAAVLKLAEKADLLIESGRPGAAERLGLGYDAVHAVNPRLVYLSVSGFGHDGPKKSEPLTDTIAQALSGLMSINLGQDGIPHRISTTIVDNLTGVYGFQAASMAILQARSDGQGRHLDVNLMQCAAAIQTPKIAEYGFRGGEVADLNPPAGTYQTKDGWMAIALIKEENFAAICRALDCVELADDNRFRTFADRITNQPTLTDLIAERCRTRPTAEWLPRFAAEGALAAPINDYGALLDDPQTQAIDAIPQMQMTPDHTVPIVRTPGQPHFEAPVPAVGSHSRTVLTEIGLEESDINALIENGTVRQDVEA